jgi:uncharacterized membrane protein
MLRNPRSTAQIAGHPIHPMLVAFPAAFLVALPVCDVVFWRTGNPFFSRVSLWLLGVALVIAVVAMAAGLTDFMGDSRIRELREAWQHLIGNVTVVLLSALNWFRRYELGDSAIVPWGLGISLLVFLILFYTGWKGWDMVYRHRVGIADQ